MSEKTKKSKPHRSISEKLGYDWVTPLPAPTNPKNIFFSEWSDEEIDWIASSSLSHGTKHKEKTDKTDKSEKSEKNEEYFKLFEDPQVLFLPFCLQDLEYNWKRPRQIFPEYQFVIYTDQTEYSNLLDPSAHLVQSPFMRSFISSIHILEYLAHTTNFAQEATTSKYVPNASGPWKPWHHVYGGSRVGAGTTHNPQVNVIGKYIVRLFWLGAWRKVLIDDLLPVDNTGHVLLPSLRIPPKPVQPLTVRMSVNDPKEKEKHQKPPKPEKELPQPTVVLWPFLLAKAVLKLANLTMKKDQDLLHFNIVHCLTGWVLQRLEIDGLSTEGMWEICKTYSKIYSWEEPELMRQASGTTEKRKKDKKNKNEKKNSPKILVPSSGAQKTSHYFMAICKDMRNLKQSTVSGLSPCWGHEILIDECRDIPLEKPPPDPEYPAWKKFRWMEWAKSKGLITEHIPLDTTRYLKCLSPFAKFTKHVVYKEVTEKESKQQFPLRKSLALMQKHSQKEGKLEKGNQSDIQRDKSREFRIATDTPPDQNTWISFEELCSQLISFNIFYKPSKFKHKARVSDMEMNEITDGNGNKEKSPSSLNLRKNDGSWNDVLWPKVLESRGNVPLYFFIDSLETKMVLINLAQAGDSERLVPLDNELSEHNFFVEYERLFGDRVKMSRDPVIPSKTLTLNRSRIHAGLKCTNLIFENYRWDTAETGKTKFFLNTYGSSSALLEIEPGRHVYRLWIKSEFSYCITILADTRFDIGCFERILEEMAEEPMRMTQFNLDISDCFGHLVGSFGTPEFSNYLRRFYHSYLPHDSQQELTKSQRYLIHAVFQKSFLRFLRYSQDFLSLRKFVNTLRTLFLDRNIRIRDPSQAVMEDSKKESFQFQSLQEKIICERASTTLAAFFKMLQMKLLYQRHRPDNKHFQAITDSLRHLYHDNFSMDQRDECLGSIVRNFFKDKRMQDFLIFYDVYKDFKWDVTVQTYSGSSELSRDYVILCRYVLKCFEDVVLSLHLFCSQTNYALRIIDNDTDEEIQRFTNNVFPNIYKPNNFGYTVIGFAWLKEVKLINWKLAVVSARTTTIKFEMEELKTMTTTAFDHYVPICKNLIGRHSIFVRENVIFTFRISCSYSNVRFNVKLFDPAKHLIVDVQGKERIIVPAVLLRFVSNAEVVSHLPKAASSRSSARNPKMDHRRSMERSGSRRESLSARKRDEINPASEFEPQMYSLEFHVVDNSWPLTKNEWDVVRKLREDTYFMNSYANKDATIQDSPSEKALKSGKEARKSMLRRVQSIEKPWYLLQYSFKSNAQVALIKDKSEEDKVYSLKKFWYQSDPDRYTRSLELRKNYLKQYIDPGCQCPSEFVRNTPVSSQSKITMLSVDTYTNSGPTKDEDDENAERMSKGPRWTEANVPPFDLTPYYRPSCPCPMDFRRKIVKTEQDFRADREERLRMIEEYNDSLNKKRQDMELWINESNVRKTLVFLWYADCRKASEAIFQENQVMRQNFFDKWATELLPPPKPEKKRFGK